MITVDVGTPWSQNAFPPLLCAWLAESMRILIAGASGVVGSRLLPQLVQAGHEVHGTTRRADRLERIESAGGHGLIMDALEADSVLEAVTVVRPDMIIHQLTDLAQRDFSGNADLRIIGTRNLVDAAKAVDCQQMITQSIAWVYGPGDSPADEATPIDLDAPGRGAASNRAVANMEQATAEVGHGTVLRYGLLYGAGTWYPDQLSADISTGALVHVDDAVEATLLALDWPAGPVNIVEDDHAPVPGRTVSNALARSRGWAPRHTWHEIWQDSRPS